MKNLDEIKNLSYKSLKIIKNKKIDDIGKLLNKYWIYKKKLSSKVSNNKINYYYDKAIKAGALGGKLIGAGGGGFLLIYAKKEKSH